MLINNISIISGGILTTLMIVFHIFFSKLFNWNKEFDKISLLNKKVIYSIHIALILFFIIFAYLSLFLFKELSNESLFSNTILILISLFWLWRTIWQIIYFKKDKNVKKPSTLHYMLVAWFSLLFFSYIIPILMQVLFK